ncbi:hypothetical protein [Vulgatibacter incomptus]|uniref:Uncharacterized protein n=1 Tax=Vulgatibacter incomptus TaxID=1391653 RepID=A0A0K1PEM8_9BACT|nr:hypothetical protein [Vulgatibacter incomptus]AKU91970.1 hypothetical protein AKJ08_2357 [Vulgatibacter incomptus]
MSGARAALGLYCAADPAYVPAAEEVRAELHAARCFADQVRDPSHQDLPRASSERLRTDPKP